MCFEVNVSVRSRPLIPNSFRKSSPSFSLSALSLSLSRFCLWVTHSHTHHTHTHTRTHTHPAKGTNENVRAGAPRRCGRCFWSSRCCGCCMLAACISRHPPPGPAVQVMRVVEPPKVSTKCQHSCLGSRLDIICMHARVFAVCMHICMYVWACM